MYGYPTEDGPECPVCDGPVDDAGRTIMVNNCSMNGSGWRHPHDCDTCGAVRCDDSC